MWTAEHRRNASREGLRYPSDLTDDEWRLVGPFIPPARHGGRLELMWPNVLRIENVVKPTPIIDWAKVGLLTLDPAVTPISAELAPAVSGAADMSKVKSIDLEALPDEFRSQRLMFVAARTPSPDDVNDGTRTARRRVRMRPVRPWLLALHSKHRGRRWRMRRHAAKASAKLGGTQWPRLAGMIAP